MSDSPFNKSNYRFAARVSKTTLTNISGIHMPRFNKFISHGITEMLCELKRNKIRM